MSKEGPKGEKPKAMTALEFELKALSAGLQIGYKKDFQWIESTDENEWCLLYSDTAIKFCEKEGLTKELTPMGLYIVYFTSFRLPTRIQRSRAKGATTPANTKYCGRPGKWGNPFVAIQTTKNPSRFVVFVIVPRGSFRELCQSIKDKFGKEAFDTKQEAQAHAALLFGCLMDVAPGQYPVHELSKYAHLSCWCKVGEPCHVDEIIKRIQSSK